MPEQERKQAIEAGLAAESVLAILSQLPVEQLPSEERMAIAAAELAAADDLLASSLGSVVKLPA